MLLELSPDLIRRRLTSLFPATLVEDIARERDVVIRTGKIDITMLVWIAARLDGLRRGERRRRGVLRPALSRTYDERGPKNARQWAGSAGKRPTHRNTLAPYQDDEGGGGPIGATAGASSGSEVQT